jgi:hypothetical protein
MRTKAFCLAVKLGITRGQIEAITALLIGPDDQAAVASKSRDDLSTGDCISALVRDPAGNGAGGLR